jgi:hypothetical protein
MQLAIVIILVIGAAYYVGRTLFKNAKGHACESGNCGCSKPAGKKAIQ